MPVPAGVVSEIFPDVAPAGTDVVRAVGVAAVTIDRVPLKATRLPVGVLSKLLPEIFTVVPAVPMVGVKLAITGASEPTVNGVLVIAVPDGLMTVIGPVVAPDGTLVTICVALDDVTVAFVPLN